LYEDRQYEERELFERIANGDEQAFTRLFYLYTPKLIPFLHKLTKNDQLAKEMLQETFLRLWTNRQELTKVQSPSAWIYRLASNISIDYLRVQGNRQRILKTIHVADTGDHVTESVDARQLKSIIHTAVDKLPEKRQQIYRLSREQGLSHQEIATELGISINTVKNQLGIALKTIQEYISRETGLTLLTVVLLFSLQK
jgi:RNA polymerase sigma-70 factor (ECF subfamily)